MINQTLKIVFHHFSMLRKIREKFSTGHRIFNFLLRVWEVVKLDLTLLIDISRSERFFLKLPRIFLIWEYPAEPFVSKGVNKIYKLNSRAYICFSQSSYEVRIFFKSLWQQIEIRSFSSKLSEICQ